MRSHVTHSKETLSGMKKWFLVFLFGISASSIGCHSRVMTEEQQFKTLFDGYQLLVVGDLPKDGSLEDVDILTLQSAYPIESKLIPGRVYVFRKTNHLSNETLALKIFPERLSRIFAWKAALVIVRPETLIPLAQEGIPVILAMEVEAERQAAPSCGFARKRCIVAVCVLGFGGVVGVCIRACMRITFGG